MSPCCILILPFALLSVYSAVKSFFNKDECSCKEMLTEMSSIQKQIIELFPIQNKRIDVLIEMIDRLEKFKEYNKKLIDCLKERIDLVKEEVDKKCCDTKECQKLVTRPPQHIIDKSKKVNNNNK